VGSVEATGIVWQLIALLIIVTQWSFCGFKCVITDSVMPTKGRDKTGADSDGLPAAMGSS